MKRLLLLWLALATGPALAACDTKATASDPQGGAARAEQKSREYESCGASLHCQDNLRCFDAVCRRSARSAVGDYYAAVGAAARSRGESDAAVAAYAQALGQYDAEKLGIPPDVECAYGSALAAGRAKKETAELAARVLHRCVLTVPAGSALRDAAFAQLATLAEAGLDPILLGAGKTADLYLTKAPARPTSDKLAIAVVATPPPTKSFAALQDKLTSADLRAGLVACWDAHFAATKKDALTVTVPVKSSWVQSEEYEDAGQHVQRFEPVAAGAPAAEACVRQVVEPAIKALKLNESFTTKLAITIK
ncbi:MAG: hypothetical protein M3680_25670 [Myxococcota bacterium]|nr:hypothetical protein [Myxococcota bacterium]